MPPSQVTRVLCKFYFVSLHSVRCLRDSSFEGHSQEQDFSGIQNGTVEGASVIPEENVSTDTPPAEGHGSALEVLQLSNGQVVWSVLDSLRAEDEDDYQSLFRRSMASSRGNDVSDDLEVRFKEHKRWPSKGSNYSQGSLASRRRPAVSSSDPRPETKVNIMVYILLCHLLTCFTRDNVVAIQN